MLNKRQRNKETLGFLTFHIFHSRLKIKLRVEEVLKITVGENFQNPIVYYYLLYDKRMCDNLLDTPILFNLLKSKIPSVQTSFNCISLICRVSNSAKIPRGVQVCQKGRSSFPRIKARPFLQRNHALCNCLYLLGSPIGSSSKLPIT